MVSLPKFTKRAAEQIARLEAVRRSHLPSGNYLSVIGWENEVEPGSLRAPLFRTYYFFSDAEGVPDEFQVECHGVKLALTFTSAFWSDCNLPFSVSTESGSYSWRAATLNRLSWPRAAVGPPATANCLR